MATQQVQFNSCDSAPLFDYVLAEEFFLSLTFESASTVNKIIQPPAIDSANNSN